MNKVYMMNLFWHQHAIHEGYIHESCDECHELFETCVLSKLYYVCSMCKIKWHASCVPNSPGYIKHPCHPKHPLELLLQGPPTYSDGKCNLCQGKLSNFVYHCKLCDFSIDVKCAKNPLPLTVDHTKCHEHTLTLMARDVFFTCNACGTHGERNPYVCLPCSLMFHYDCIDLPHVININRHEHRISHACALTPGNQICEICRQDINWRYGAYSCNKCPDRFFHSRCATRKDVWDGVELEGTPEEEVDNAPFKVIDEGVINHFSHEKHNLLLIEDVIIDGGDDIHCEACCHPISFERYYNCMECNYMLHEDCANLPRHKRHGLSLGILSLSTGEENNQIFNCSACYRDGSGFRYTDDKGLILDVHCASLSSFRHRKIHPHTLFLTITDLGDCVACESAYTYVLSCIDCKYSLDFECATLPVVIKHRCDDHYFFLSSGEKAKTGKYWCEICEAEADPEKWFYTCYDCGVVCHTGCVIGNSLNIKPGLLFNDEDNKIEAVLNNHNSRPVCSGCGTRCLFPMVYKLTREDSGEGGYWCSLHCMTENPKEPS